MGGAGGLRRILRLVRVSGDIVGMVEAASHRNKGTRARSPSRQGHLWLRRRVAGMFSSQICEAGEGSFSRCD
jgi:hypothetical protein